MGRRVPEPPRPTVLIVEDEPLVRILTADALSEAGFDVLEAWNADEALALLDARAGDVQVLCTDVQMPGSMDGLALAETVHRNWPHILLLLASGHSRPGPDGPPGRWRVLPKPYATAALVRHVNELLTCIKA
jgi:CheY-like chemotaxis protein